MKDLNLLVFMTQLGLSVVLPFVGFLLLAVWLQNRFGLGGWVLWAGIILGAVTAIDGFRHSLKTLARMGRKKGEDTPPVSFNDHD